MAFDHDGTYNPRIRLISSGCSGAYAFPLVSLPRFEDARDVVGVERVGVVLDRRRLHGLDWIRVEKSLLHGPGAECPKRAEDVLRRDGLHVRDQALHRGAP